MDATPRVLLKQRNNAVGRNTQLTGEAFLERDDIDLIDINAPSDVHKEITIAAVQAGKHVFLRKKPLALTLKDAREMLEAVEAAGVKHMVGFNYRFAPAVMLAKKS
ncbi:hypothetical protein GCM10020331_079770 [Ectobacillus funiculus]